MTRRRYKAVLLLVLTHPMGCAHAQGRFVVQFKEPTPRYDTQACPSRSGLTLLPRHDIDAHRRQASQLAARPDAFVTTPAVDLAGAVWLPIDRVEGGQALVSDWTKIAQSNALLEEDLHTPCAGFSCWKVLLAQESCTPVLAKCAITRIDGVEGPPECEPIAILDESPLIRATPPPPAPQSTPQLAQADASLARIDQASSAVRRQLGRARQERDAVHSLCIGDKLSQIDQAGRSARDRAGALRAAAQHGDTELADHEFTILTVLRQRVELLASEANQCIGEEGHFVGQTVVTGATPEGQPPLSIKCNQLMPLVEKQLSGADGLRLTTWFANKYQLLKAVADHRFSVLLATPNQRLWEKVRVSVSCFDSSDPTTIDIDTVLQVSNTNSADNTDWYEASSALQGQYAGELSRRIEMAAHTLCGSSNDDLLVEKTSPTDDTYRCR